MRLPKYKSTWLLHLPSGVQRNPLGMFLAFLCVISGSLYASNLATSTVITENLDSAWLRAWGAYLAVGGLVKIYANLTYNYPAEKFGCRLITVALIVYSSWVVIIVGLKSTMSVVLSLALIFALEARVAAINLILSPIQLIPEDKNGTGTNS